VQNKNADRTLRILNSAFSSLLCCRWHHPMNGRHGAKTRNSKSKSRPIATVVHKQNEDIREEGENTPMPNASPFVIEVIAIEGPISPITAAILSGIIIISSDWEDDLFLFINFAHFFPCFCLSPHPIDSIFAKNEAIKMHCPHRCPTPKMA